MTAFVSGDPKMIESFQKGRDIYSSIASISFNLPYEECFEFNPITGAQQPEGKARRSEAKVILLGMNYGRSVNSLADQLYGKNDDMTDEEKLKGAQRICDIFSTQFPSVPKAIKAAQDFARIHGYVETILGRRRHLPNMQLPMYEFEPLPGYVNPDVDPLDTTTLLAESSKIPPRVVAALTEKLSKCRYAGQRYTITQELREKYHIAVINHSKEISKASRQCFNSVIQGSAAEQTKLAILMLETDPRWKAIGGRLILPVHDRPVINLLWT